MRYIFILFSCCMLVGFSSFAQDKSKTTNKEKTEAKKRPEDDIKQYWFVMIKTGPKQDFDSTTQANLFKGHMENMNRLYYEGKLKVAGPFGKNDNSWRGLFIYDCETREEAEAMVKTDPAISAGLLAVEIVSWWTAPIGSFVKGAPEKPKE